MPTPLHGLSYAGLDVGVGDDFERLQQSGDLGRVDVIIERPDGGELRVDRRLHQEHMRVALAQGLGNLLQHRIRLVLSLARPVGMRWPSLLPHV